MDLENIRQLASDLDFALFGSPVPVTVGVRWDEPVSTTGIWRDESPPEQTALALDHQRIDRERIMAFNRDDLPRVPIGTVISAAEKADDEAKMWRVTGVDKVGTRHLVVSMIEEETVFG